MPIVVPQQEVAPGALNTGGVIEPAQPGGELAQGVRQATQAASDIAIMQQRQRNADRLFQVEAELGDAYRKFETQQQERKGQNAWGITDDAAEWWAEAAPRFEDTLENDAQKRLFQESVAKMRGTSLDAFSSYESAQRRASLEESGKAAILSAIDFGASNFGNPDAIVGARKDITERVEALASLNGWSQERADAELAENLTTLHEQVLQNMVDEDPAGAKEYYAEHEHEIRGSARDTIKDAIETGEVATAGQQGADEIFSAEMSETEALAAARKKYKGKERDEVVRRLKVRYDEQRIIKNEDQSRANDEAWAVFERTGSTARIPPTTVARMDKRLLSSMRTQEFNPADRISTDWAQYEELVNLAQSNPTEFAQIDLRMHYGKLNIQERATLSEMQKDIQTNMTAGAGTLVQQLGEAARLMEWDSGDAQTRGMFERAVRQEIADAQQATGRKLNYEERQTIIDRNLAKGEVIGGGLFGLVDPNKQFFEVSGTEDEAAFVPDIPEKERFRIEKALEANGIPVTDEAVQRLYRLKLGL